MDPRERNASLMTQDRPELAELVAIRSPEPGAPTVLLYAHYDVQPPLNEAVWRAAGPHSRPQRERGSGRDAAMALTEELFLPRYAAIRS